MTHGRPAIGNPPAVPRLRRSDVATPGFLRRKHGKGFRYVDADGAVVDAVVRARIEALVIPPAWTEVWICPWPNGHIQATGFDAAGRKQYRYHDDWRRRRDQANHERVLAVAAGLPTARARFATDLALDGFPRDRVLATAARLLDVGFFRIGSEQYEEANGTYGLTTLHRHHVTVDGDRLQFEYVAKSGKHRMVSVTDPAVLEVVEALRRRRSGPSHLLAWKDGRTWRGIDADDVNAYLREASALEISAKDFRTWHATVLMAVALAVTQAPASDSARKRALSRAYSEVSYYLGNTPAVARASYVDPRVVDLWRDGSTIRRALDELGSGGGVGEPAIQGPVEAAVLKLLRT